MDTTFLSYSDDMIEAIGDIAKPSVKSQINKLTDADFNSWMADRKHHAGGPADKMWQIEIKPNETLTGKSHYFTWNVGLNPIDVDRWLVSAGFRKQSRYLAGRG